MVTHYSNLSIYPAPGAILSSGDTAGTKADNLPGLLFQGRRMTHKSSHENMGVKREFWTEGTAHAKAPRWGLNTLSSREREVAGS